MHHSFFPLASALTISSIITITSASVAGSASQNLLCVNDTYNEVFNAVGMGLASDGAQQDIENFCYSWIDIPTVTSYFTTITPTTFVDYCFLAELEKTNLI
jgi:hypothetical protein